jgi:glycosyltransferase involved in cell wall biosynthesis
LQGWADAGPRHELLLYSAEPLSAGPSVDRATIRIVPGSPNTWWEQVSLPAAVSNDHADVFFAPAYTAPLRLQIPTVVAIHDVSFAAHPEWFHRREGLRRRLLTRKSAERARAVLTISQFSRTELVNVLGVPAGRIHVIPPGVTGPPLAPGGEREARLLFVGSIFNRRHVPDLIRAFATMARRHPRATLDLVGDDRTYPRQDLPHVIGSVGLDERVKWHRYVPEADLARFYQRARAFAFLSEYEGLGLPPLEALAAQVPPVLLDTPVARESCGQAALYVALGDLAGTAEALELALVDEGVRGRLLAAAPDVLARYSWADAARKTMDLLEHVGGGA